MFIAAQNDFNIDFSKSWMIGDTWRDIAAGKAVQMKTILVAEGLKDGSRRSVDELEDFEQDYNAASLPEAVGIVLGQE